MIIARLEIHQRPPFTLIAGGGPAADLIRTMDRIHGLGDEQAHWLAIDALDLNARILASLLPGCVVVDRPEEIHPACDRGQIRRPGSAPVSRGTGRSSS